VFDTVDVDIADSTALTRG